MVENVSATFPKSLRACRSPEGLARSFDRFGESADRPLNPTCVPQYRITSSNVALQTDLSHPKNCTLASR